MTSADKIRVFQVATGNLGSEMIGRITAHPDLQLVGLHCYTADKIGRDAGDIVGIGPVGVTATGTVEEPAYSPMPAEGPGGGCHHGNKVEMPSA